MIPGISISCPSPSQSPIMPFLRPYKPGRHHRASVLERETAFWLGSLGQQPPYLKSLLGWILPRASPGSLPALINERLIFSRRGANFPYDFFVLGRVERSSKLYPQFLDALQFIDGGFRVVHAGSATCRAEHFSMLRPNARQRVMKWSGAAGPYGRIDAF
jgi:hypothetical protein